jgi:hypothetical protein
MSVCFLCQSIALEPVRFLQTLICTNRAKCFFLDVCLLGLRPKPHSLFAKREAKTLIRILRIPAQSAETAVSAGGAGAAPPQIFTLHIDYTSAFEKSG